MRSSLRVLASSMLRRTRYEILKHRDHDHLIAQHPSAARKRQDFLICHPFVKGAPHVELVDVPAGDRPGRQASARRLLNAWKLASAQESACALERADSDLWTNLVRKELGELLDICAADDAQALATYLMHFGEQYTWFGGLTFSLDGYVTGETATRRLRAALTYHDKLICLAEALGVLPLEHAEHGRWGDNLYSDVNAVLAKIEQQLNISLGPPLGAIPVTGLKTDRGVFHYRHLNAIYTAYLIAQLVSNDTPVCEFGGGLGAVALYARRMGLLDYTLYDLPITNLFAGNFLINALGADSVTLLGESGTKDSIKILPYWKCLEAPDGIFGLSLNQDSFPEIDEELVKQLLQQIRRMTREYFVSINHESQNEMTPTRSQLNISAILKDESGFARISRTKYWMREGYVEEVYRLARV